MSDRQPVTRAAGTLAGGVAVVAFSSDSPQDSRGNVHLADVVRQLRRDGIPSRLFQVQLTADDEENRRRVQRLVDRVTAERCRWGVFSEVWTPELGRQLRSAGIRLIETRSHTFEDAVFCGDDRDLLTHLAECRTGRALDELADLLEMIGPQSVRPVTSIDLRILQACGYKEGFANNEFYRDVLDDPEIAKHRGCAYCLNARRDTSGTPEEIATLIVERIRGDRQTFPSVDTFWMAFAETFYDALGIAFRTTRGDPVWYGITLAMQCRPDVIAQRASDIEALATEAAACGTRLRIGVVGFENFSPREILALNRGVAPEHLDTAASILNRWQVHPPNGLIVEGFTPSFILFTPWTRIEDLELNLERIERHGLWNANIERLRIGPGTPAFEKARRDGLVNDGPVRPASHPNGYTSERDIRFADPRVAAVSAGFETLRPHAMNELPELLTSVVAAVRAADDPGAIDWDDIARSWADIGAAAQGA